MQKAARERKGVSTEAARNGDLNNLSDGAAVIWVDAHADINTAATSSSGNVHGMPLAFLTGLESSGDHEDNDVFTWLRKEHLFNPERLVYIGLRDVDQGEKDFLRRNPQIKAFSMDDIERYAVLACLTCDIKANT